MAQGPVAQGPVAQGLGGSKACGSRALLLKGFVALGLCGSRALWLKGSRAANNCAVGGGSDGIIIQLCLNSGFELQLLTVDFLDLGVNLF